MCPGWTTPMIRNPRITTRVWGVVRLKQSDDDVLYHIWYCSGHTALSNRSPPLRPICDEGREGRSRRREESRAPVHRPLGHLNQIPAGGASRRIGGAALRTERRAQASTTESSSVHYNPRDLCKSSAFRVCFLISRTGTCSWAAATVK